MGTVELIDHREKVPRQIFLGTFTSKQDLKKIMRFIKGKGWIEVVVKTFASYQKDYSNENTA